MSVRNRPRWNATEAPQPKPSGTLDLRSIETIQPRRCAQPKRLSRSPERTTSPSTILMAHIRDLGARAPL
jgi:hypothetical protein